MKRNSIVYKLFTITLVFFCALLGFSFLIQSFFLEEYYTKKKIKTIKSNINMFSKDYLKGNWSSGEMEQKMDLFIEKNNSPMIIVDERGKIKHKTKHGDILIIRSDEGKFYMASRRVFTEDINLVPKIGDPISIYGSVYIEKNIFEDILKIDYKEEVYHNKTMIKKIHERIHNSKFPSDLRLVEVNGEIVHISDRASYEENRNVSYKNYVLMSEINKAFTYNKFGIDRIQNDAILKYELLDPSFNSTNMIFIKPLINHGGENTFIFVIISFQPINEAVDIIGDFILYVFLFALIFIIILSLIYSKIVTSSLLRINRVAEKMANLDFSERCKIKSKDELGNLSKSINIMADKLSNSMENLERANEKLVDDIERERKEEEIKRQFIADVSHELKTPLGIIKGLAEGIDDGIYELNKDNCIKGIIDEIQKMDILILDMLTISKLQSMGYKLNMKKFYIDDLINKLIEKYAHIFNEKKLKVNCFCEAFNVYGDEAKIDRVIDNLLSNAVKYSNNRAKVNIRTQESGESVYFYIENTGAYISEGEIDNIWDRFYRVEHSRSRLFGGTGLGLNIVKNILELHKSNYGVRNTEDGVEFYFSLPKIE